MIRRGAFRHMAIYPETRVKMRVYGVINGLSDNFIY
jgi:hypothetical protein